MEENKMEELLIKLNTAELALNEVERVISERVRNGDYALEDLLEDVQYALKKIDVLEDNQ